VRLIVTWTDELLRRNPELELRAACSPNISAEGRLLAWQRYEIKRWYEAVCGAKVLLDLNELDEDMAPQVVELRKLSSGAILWRACLPAPQPLEPRADLPDAV
jgi:hypothetical protein